MPVSAMMKHKYQLYNRCVVVYNICFVATTNSFSLHVVVMTQRVLA